MSELEVKQNKKKKTKNRLDIKEGLFPEKRQRHKSFSERLQRGQE
jgi:hypothetical protein